MRVSLGVGWTVAVLLLAAVTSNVRGQTPADTAYYNGHYYEYYNTGMTWIDATIFAGEQSNAPGSGVNGYLAVVETGAENSMLDGICPGDCWVGGTDSAVERVWRWEATGVQYFQQTGCSWGDCGYSVNSYPDEWAYGQPNGDTGSNCMALDGGQWNDWNCYTSETFLVEYNDYDECLVGEDNCDANAACSNTVGSFLCTCNAGYSGDGVTCSVSDACVAGIDDCDPVATCTPTGGATWTCACPPEYSGSGQVCTPNTPTSNTIALSGNLFHSTDPALYPNDMVFGGLGLSDDTYTKFALAGECDNPSSLGLTHWPPGKSDSQLDTNVLAPGTFSLCYTIDAGATWYEQTGTSTAEWVDVATVASAVYPPVVTTTGTATLVVASQLTATDYQVRFAGSDAAATDCSEAAGSTSLTLDCGTDTILAIASAVYGDDSNGCGSIDPNSCYVDVTTTVAAQCIGSSTCSVPVSAAVFGSPCAGSISKSLTATAVCGDCTTYATATATPSSWYNVNIDFAGGTGAYGLCVASAGESTFFVQDGRATQVIVSTAATESISSVSPRRIGEDPPTTAAFTFAGVRAGPDTFVAFSDDGCNTRYGETAVVNDGDAVYMFRTDSLPAGVYSTCYSVSSGTWYEQTSPLTVITVYESDPGTLGTTPTTFGYASVVDVYFPLAQVSQIGTVMDIRAGTGCGGASEQLIDYTSTSPVAVGPFASAGTYTVCYSVDGGASYSVTDEITAVGTTTTTVSDVDPDIAYTGSGLSFTFTGAEPSATTSVSLVDSGSGCPGPNRVPLTSSTTVEWPVDLAVDTYDVCYTTDTNVNWLKQDGLTVEIRDMPSASSITDISPSVVAAGVPRTLTVTSNFLDSYAASELAFAPSGLCGYPSEHAFSTAFTPGTGSTATPVVVTAAVSEDAVGATVELVACVSPDGIQFAETTATLTVAVGHESVVTDVSPTTVLDGPAFEVTFVGAVYTPTTKVALSWAATGCSEATMSIRNLPPVDPPIFPGNLVGSDSFGLCYSIDNGTTWYRQRSAYITRTSNSNLALVTAVDPDVIGHGQPESLNLTFAPGHPTADSWIKFVTGSCADPGYGATAWPTAVVRPLASGITVAGTLKLCYGNSTHYDLQVKPETALTVVNAVGTTLASVSPPAAAVGSAFTLTYTTSSGATILTSTTRFDLASPGSCGSAGATSVPLTEDGTIDLVAPASAGPIAVCVSTGGAYVEQTLVSLALIEATDSTVTASSPQTIGSIQTAVTLSGATGSSVTWVGATVTGDCANTGGYVVGPVNLAYGSSVVTVPDGVPTGSYVWCYSVDSGGSYTEQTDGDVWLTVVTGTTSSITDFGPQAIGAQTTPMLYFTGGLRTATTYVAFLQNGTSDCSATGLHVGLTKITDESPTTLGSAIPSLPANENFHVCYSVNHGSATPEWYLQDGLSLKVREARADAITGITPTTIAAGTTPTVTLTTGSAPVYQGKVAFAVNGACSNAFNRKGEFDVSSSVTDVAIGSPIADPAVYSVCFTTGPVWVAQIVAPVVTVITTLPTSVNSMSPDAAGVGTSFVVDFNQGLLATPTALVAFAANDSANCASSGARLSTTAYTVDGPFVPSAPLGSPGSYYLCYTADGTNWQGQTNAGTALTVFAVAATDVTAVNPDYVGAGTSVPVTFAGVVPSQKTVVALTSVGDTACAAPAVVVNVTEADSSPAVAFPPGSATYALCVSLDGGYNWVYQTQSGARIAASAGTGYEVASFTPNAIAINTMYELDLTVPLGLSPTMAFAITAAPGSDCGSVVNNVTDLEATLLPMSSGLATPGTYSLCVAVDGVNYVAQANVSLVVADATANSIIAVSPGVIDENRKATLTFTGGTPTPTSKIALALPGGCTSAITRLGETEWTAPGPLTTATAVTTGESLVNVSVCYTTGAGWYEQSSPYVTVVTACDLLTTCDTCAANPYCSFCLATQTCATQHVSCDSRDTIGAPANCPVLLNMYPGVGKLNGSTAVNVSASYFSPVVTPGAWQCSWEGGAVLTDAAYKTEELVECLSPPQDAVGTTVPTVGVLLNGNPYSDNFLLFQYYDCAAFSDDGCGGCYDANLRPECGFCQPTRECTEEGQCAAADWAGTECPTIDDIAPASGLWAGGYDVTVYGQLYEDGRIACAFGGGEGWGGETINATVLSPDELKCQVPRFRGNPDKLPVQVDLSLVYAADVNASYSEDTASFAFLAEPPAGIQSTKEGGGASAGVIAGVTTTFVFLLVAGIVAAVFGRRYYLDWQRFQPPPLTQAIRDKIVYGQMKDYTGVHDDIADEMTILQLFIMPGNAFVFTVADITQMTEADMISKAMVILFESEGVTLEILKDFISREIATTASQSTLFRTNSFATKMFRTYSKMVGLDYLHSTLGYTVNYELENAKEVDFDIKGENAQMASFSLLAVCQRVFSKVVKSSDDVPPAFRHIFHHVQQCMTERFPVTGDDLAAVVAEQIRAGLEDTSYAFQQGAMAYTEFRGLEGLVSSNVNDLTHVLAPLNAKVDEFGTAVSNLTGEIKTMQKAFDTLEGALVPNSQAARRLLLEHTQKQNSVAVGGFFFLRFLVPALTVPESFCLARELPNPHQRKLLVMVGKVVQNLSNNLEFGKKEVHMKKLNEFIVQNRHVIHRLFDELSTPTDEPVPPFPIPKSRLFTAKCILYEHMKLNYDKIVDSLSAPAAEGESDQDAARRQQLCDMFRLQMDHLNSIKERSGAGGLESMKFSFSGSRMGSGANSFASERRGYNDSAVNYTSDPFAITPVEYNSGSAKDGNGNDAGPAVQVDPFADFDTSGPPRPSGGSHVPSSFLDSGVVAPFDPTILGSMAGAFDPTEWSDEDDDANAGKGGGSIFMPREPEEPEAAPTDNAAFGEETDDVDPPLPAAPASPAAATPASLTDTASLPPPPPLDTYLPPPPPLDSSSTTAGGGGGVKTAAPMPDPVAPSSGKDKPAKPLRPGSIAVGGKRRPSKPVRPMSSVAGRPQRPSRAPPSRPASGTQ